MEPGVLALQELHAGVALELVGERQAGRDVRRDRRAGAVVPDGDREGEGLAKADAAVAVLVDDGDGVEAQVGVVRRGPAVEGADEVVRERDARRLAGVGVLLGREEEAGGRDGVAVGFLSADSFIDNDGKEINAYEKVSVTLYFATEDGKNLIAGQRKVVYNTNISMEKMVVEQLIKGPQLAGYYPTINPDTKILSVTNKDGICYINLSEEFLKQPGDISSDVVVYSIANSLIDLHNVNRVQIQVNGNSKILFRETLSLEESFERNLDIVLKEEP